GRPGARWHRPTRPRERGRPSGSAWSGIAPERSARLRGARRRRGPDTVFVCVTKCFLALRNPQHADVVFFLQGHPLTLLSSIRRRYAMKIGMQHPSLKHFFAASLLLALAACGGGKTVVESDLGIKGAPDWVNKGTQAVNDKDGRLFHGVGAAPSLGDDALQRSTADDRARAEVARMLSTYIDVVGNDYSSAAGTGANANADQAVSRQIKAVTKVNLAGSNIIRRRTDSPTTLVYSI